MTLTDKHSEQIKQLIQNIHEQKNQIPYVSDLLNHPIYGSFLGGIDEEDQKHIENMIHEYIKQTIRGLKTKGGQLFKRFYDNNTDTFWRFRKLNAQPTARENDEFQSLGKQIEEEMFRLESILTANMMRKPQGLNKTISAFYDIVYSFFPQYNQIK